MKVFITGAQGCLGLAMQNLLRRENINFLGVDLPQFDITNYKKLNEAVLNYRPDLILHFAAISDVDECERNPELALRTNGLATLGIATLAHKINAKLLYTSTNFVFDGNVEEPYFEFSAPNPISQYGKTKYVGEKYIKEIYDRYFIVRTAWLFGKNSKTFASKFLQQKDKPRSVSIICDQVGSFTYVEDLVEAIFLIIKSENYGTYHIVNAGFGTWLDFMLKAKELIKFNTELIPVKTEELNLPAPRPRFAVLGSKNYEFLFEKKMRKWQEALGDFLKILNSQ
ncbi:MAG: dTDP-4-dehydrorhamnose reductase [bacterium]